MNIMNATQYVVSSTQATDQNGKVHLLLVAKATYDFPKKNNEPLSLSEDQTPIFDSDIFEGEPGVTNTFFEDNWAFRKLKCDVIVKGTAYAPEGKSSQLLVTGFNFSDCKKRAWVVGDRVWQEKGLGLGLSPPKPFSAMPITYSRTYGGTWLADETQSDKFTAIELDNPVGTGFYKSCHKSLLIGKVAPNIVPVDYSIDSNTSFKPISFGPIGRHWKPRSAYAGTYDQTWIDNTFPMWPSDFDERFFQSAPIDQQVNYPVGGEVIELLRMDPKRQLIQFELPDNLSLPIVAIMNTQQVNVLKSNIDTIEIDADSKTISLVWRARLPLRRSLKEVQMLALGKVCKRWWKSQLYGTSDCGCGGIEANDEDLISVEEAASL